MWSWHLHVCVFPLCVPKEEEFKQKHQQVKAQHQSEAQRLKSRLEDQRSKGNTSTMGAKVSSYSACLILSAASFRCVVSFVKSAAKAISRNETFWKTDFHFCGYVPTGGLSSEVRNLYSATQKVVFVKDFRKSVVFVKD